MDTENIKSKESQEQPNNPLHGVKLADILDYHIPTGLDDHAKTCTQWQCQNRR